MESSLMMTSFTKLSKMPAIEWMAVLDGPVLQTSEHSSMLA